MKKSINKPLLVYLKTEEKIGLLRISFVDHCFPIHFIVADGWAGASNPRLDQTHPPTAHNHQKRSLSYFFLLVLTDGWINGLTNRQTKPLIELCVRN